MNETDRIEDEFEEVCCETCENKACAEKIAELQEKLRLCRRKYYREHCENIRLKNVFAGYIQPKPTVEEMLEASP